MGAATGGPGGGSASSVTASPLGRAGGRSGGRSGGGSGGGSGAGTFVGLRLMGLKMSSLEGGVEARGGVRILVWFGLSLVCTVVECPDHYRLARDHYRSARLL
jgi:hypothetical protein